MKLSKVDNNSNSNNIFKIDEISNINKTDKIYNNNKFLK